MNREVKVKDVSWSWGCGNLNVLLEYGVEILVSNFGLVEN